MIGTVIKGAAYAKAPKTTFAVMHPVKAMRMKKMQYDLRHAYAPRLAAIGAAAIAFPLGLWIGRRLGANHDED